VPLPAPVAQTERWRFRWMTWASTLPSRIPFPPSTLKRGLVEDTTQGVRAHSLPPGPPPLTAKQLFVGDYDSSAPIRIVGLRVDSKKPSWYAKRPINPTKRFCTL
jgi:hypothetical protein